MQVNIPVSVDHYGKCWRNSDLPYQFEITTWWCLLGNFGAVKLTLQHLEARKSRHEPHINKKVKLYEKCSDSFLSFIFHSWNKIMKLPKAKKSEQQQFLRAVSKTMGRLRGNPFSFGSQFFGLGLVPCFAPRAQPWFSWKGTDPKKNALHTTELRPYQVTLEKASLKLGKDWQKNSVMSSWLLNMASSCFFFRENKALS